MFSPDSVMPIQTSVGPGVLERVHHALARDVEDQQGDRRRQLDVLHVVVETDAGVAAHLVGERLERFGQAGGAERGSVQVTDQRADAIGGLLLRIADLLELRVELGEILLVEELARDVDLE